jgi:succinate dehydrogenase hydrophobic anchor subunit
MIKKSRFPLLVAFIVCLEGIIYLWATWTTEAEFVFDKCARNSGRVSSAINLIILLMIGWNGLKRIYLNESQKDTFRILITLFAVNHLIHFFYLFQNFNHHAMQLNMSENKHGFITFISIVVIPVLLWIFKNINPLLYAVIIIHLFNVSYFIMETFYSKVKPDKPAYHNQLGIFVTVIALLYIVYRIFSENRTRLVSNRIDQLTNR